MVNYQYAWKFLRQPYANENQTNIKNFSSELAKTGRNLEELSKEYIIDYLKQSQIKITNDSKDFKTISLKQGEGFAQGIFTEFLVTYDDETTAERVGGFGSTSK